MPRVLSVLGLERAVVAMNELLGSLIDSLACPTAQAPDYRVLQLPLVAKLIKVLIQLAVGCLVVHSRGSGVCWPSDFTAKHPTRVGLKGGIR